MENQNSFSVLFDQLQKKMGLVVCSGTRFSQFKELLNIELQKIEKKNIQYFSSPQFDPNADIIIVDVPVTKELFFHILDFCDEGRLVVLQMYSPSVFSAVQKLFELCTGESRKHMIWRLVEHLSFVMNQIDISGLNSESVSHFEFILINSEIRDILQSENFSVLQDLLLRTQDKMGILTLNQSLLNSLIKRKIDLKSAFEWSREPEDLDYLLKKVGV